MNRSGMTLMELIVALTVTGMALSMGYGAFSSLVDNRSRVTEATAATARAAAIRSSLSSWLEGARVTGQPDEGQFRGLDGVYQDLPDDELWFLTTSDTPLETNETIMRLYVDRDVTTPEKGLVAAVTEWRGTASTVIQIDSTVTGLELRYLSSALGEQRWLPSWISTTLLPTAVEIELTAPADLPLHPLLEMPMLVIARGGQ